MHQQFANRFYGSDTWKRCRKDYSNYRGNLCERCLAKGIINAGTDENPLQVHHKIKLTPTNINDPAVTLNWDNLELLCSECHHDEHNEGQAKRWSVDECGNVTIKE